MLLGFCPNLRARSVAENDDYAVDAEQDSQIIFILIFECLRCPVRVTLRTSGNCIGTERVVRNDDMAATGTEEPFTIGHPFH